MSNLNIENKDDNNGSKKIRIREIRSYDSKYVYIDCELYFLIINQQQQQQQQSIDIREFKLIIMNSIDSLFGEIGSQILFDIIKFSNNSNNNCRAFIRLLARDYIKFHLCLTLMNEWKNSTCQFRIHKTSHCLASLSVPNTDFIENNLITTMKIG